MSVMASRVQHDHVAAQLHMPILGRVPPATEGTRPGKSTETDRNSTSGPLQLVGAVDEALARIGMSDKQAASIMGISGGTWSKQKNGVDGCHIQLDKLALLPENFHREFTRIYAGLVGLHVTHESIADLLIARVGQLLLECHSLAAQLRRTA
jgi:hypothetical protein